MFFVCNAHLTISIQLFKIVGKILFRYRMENTGHIAVNLLSHIRSSSWDSFWRSLSPLSVVTWFCSDFFLFLHLKWALTVERFSDPDIKVMWLGFSMQYRERTMPAVFRISRDVVKCALQMKNLTSYEKLLPHFMI